MRIAEWVGYLGLVAFLGRRLAAKAQVGESWVTPTRSEMLDPVASYHQGWRRLI